MKVRKSVKTFSYQMELLLREHDGEFGKAGWEDLEILHLLQIVEQRLRRAKIAFEEECNPTKVCRAVINVANFCMMVSDNIKKRKGFWK